MAGLPADTVEFIDLDYDCRTSWSRMVPRAFAMTSRSRLSNTIKIWRRQSCVSRQSPVAVDAAVID